MSARAAAGEGSLKTWGGMQKPPITGSMAEAVADALVKDKVLTKEERASGWVWRNVLGTAAPVAPVAAVNDDSDEEQDEEDEGEDEEQDEDEETDDQADDEDEEEEEAPPSAPSAAPVAQPAPERRNASVTPAPAAPVEAPVSPAALPYSPELISTIVALPEAQWQAVGRGGIVLTVEERDARRSGRKRSVRAKTINPKRIGKHALALGRAQYPEDPGPLPPTRGHCAEGSRPCPRASCRHNLFLDVEARGAIKVTFPYLEPEEMTESCALDVADQGGITLEEVGALLNLTRERVRQLEVRALAKVYAAAPELREQIDRPGRVRLPVLQESDLDEDGDEAYEKQCQAAAFARAAKVGPRPINPLTGEGTGTVLDRVVMAFVEAAPRALSIDDLAPLGMNRNALSVRLSQLTSKLRLVRVSKGLYRLRAAVSEQARAAE